MQQMWHFSQGLGLTQLIPNFGDKNLHQQQWPLDTLKYLHTCFIRKSFVRNLDGQITKKLSVLKPRRLRN